MLVHGYSGLAVGNLAYFSSFSQSIHFICFDFRNLRGNSSANADFQGLCH